MSTIETVRGPVAADELGVTLPHEHILIIEPEALQNYGSAYGPSYWDEEVRVADAIARLTEVRAAGTRRSSIRLRPDSAATSPESSGSTSPSTSTSSLRRASTRSSPCRTS
jgi:Phosphotriesterase family